MLAFALALTVATALLFGLLPALRASRFASRHALLQDTRAGGSRGRTRSRRVLIVVETALSLALLICAGLLLNSFMRLSSVNPGFSSDRALVAEIDLPDVNYRDAERRIQFFSSLLRRVAQLPGVSSAAATEPAAPSRKPDVDRFRT